MAANIKTVKNVRFLGKSVTCIFVRKDKGSFVVKIPGFGRLRVRPLDTNDSVFQKGRYEWMCSKIADPATQIFGANPAAAFGNYCAFLGRADTVN
jgi:hypothetical protein